MELILNWGLLLLLLTLCHLLCMLVFAAATPQPDPCKLMRKCLVSSDFQNDLGL